MGRLIRKALGAILARAFPYHGTPGEMLMQGRRGEGPAKLKS